VSAVPPQHGAWAFLGLPLIVGVAFAERTPLLLVLAIGWIAAYPASYFVLAIEKDATSRHPDSRPFVRPLLRWSAVALPCAAILLACRPWLVWVGALYLAGFLVSFGFARRRDDRALANDAVFILQCALMVPVTWAVSIDDSSWTPPAAAGAPAGLWLLTLATALLLAGSTVHVKSLIRERANPRFRTGSRWFALASLAASIGLAALWGAPGGLLLPLPFAYFAGRALLLRGPAPRPARIGLIELGGFVLLAAAALVGTPS
jgi:hypothetical protein